MGNRSTTERPLQMICDLEINTVRESSIEKADGGVTSCNLEQKCSKQDTISIKTTRKAKSTSAERTREVCRYEKE